MYICRRNCLREVYSLYIYYNLHISTLAFYTTPPWQFPRIDWRGARDENHEHCMPSIKLTKHDRIAAGIVHAKVAGLSIPQHIATQIEHAKKLCGGAGFSTATGWRCCCSWGWGGAETTLFFSSIIEFRYCSHASSVSMGW